MKCVGQTEKRSAALDEKVSEGAAACVQESSWDLFISHGHRNPSEYVSSAASPGFRGSKETAKRLARHPDSRYLVRMDS